ncbi:MAG: hypothetical protein IJJ14_03055, partial [Coriobacteriales bacterium]|nr:hypothetical protein [Coriobacteriales bacterium]
VPAVDLPKTGGGTARFTDVSDTTAAAADVGSGKYFYTAAGVRTAGTNSGGGGSGIGTLLTAESLGTISTSSTTATDISHNVTVSDVGAYDLLIVETSVNTKTNGRHAATVRLIWLTASSNINTKDGSAIATATWNVKLSSNGTATTRSSTTARGIYPYSCSLATSSGKTNATLVMYRCYNSTQTGTINGTYTTRVYGVKAYDLIGG